MTPPLLKLADQVIKEPTPSTVEKPKPKTAKYPVRRVRLVNAVIDQIRPPAKGEAVVYDGTQKWLALRVRPSGVKAFYMIRKFRGRTIKFKLGDYPSMTIEQARQATRDAVQMCDQGIDPANTRRAQRGDSQIGSRLEDAKIRPATGPANIKEGAPPRPPHIHAKIGRVM